MYWLILFIIHIQGRGLPYPALIINIMITHKIEKLIICIKSNYVAISPDDRMTNLSVY